MLRLLLLPLVALAAAYALDLPRIGAAALFGVAAWAGLLLAGRVLTLQFFAFAMFGAVVFGFMAAVFASLVNRSVYEMLALPWNEQFVGITLALAAVAFTSLALVGGVWAMVRKPLADQAADDKPDLPR
ncbi:MAG: hypothetical protein U5L03_11445 [Burkholderiaceae bacterium]|nr:hypothetical protein [Burkholderiaceae bacterium]